MKNLISTALRYENNQLKILNQKKLPHTEEWLHCQTAEQLRDIILDLKVRGAPLIGVSAVVMLGVLAEQNESVENIQHAAELLRSARPTAVNLMHCIDRFIQALKTSRQEAINTAEKIFQEDVQLCDNIAEHGSSLIQSNQTIMTYCNTGGLATAGVGTALGIIKKAHQQQKNIHVYTNETRPLLQGGRLTAWELMQANIPYTLICDNMAAHIMRTKKIDAIFVGADRIARNGDFANKIGTYMLAVLAKAHNVPFYVAAPYTTLDVECASGDNIEIEERHANEVRGVSGYFGDVIWSPNNSPAANPAFDVTPAELVTAFVLDKGVFSPTEIKNIY